jgi:4-carboxymuconolactone decarboxylase
MIMTPEPTPAQRKIGGFAPKLAELTDDVLYGEIWERPGLSKRDRSLVTVAALVALYRHDQLPSHLGRAVAHGVSTEEIAELIIHIAFYAGWPTAMTAVAIARKQFEDSGEPS